MRIDLTEAQRRLQETFRRFFATDYPQDILAKTRAGAVLTRADHVRSQQALQAQGWFGIGWPVAHGGPDWSPVDRYLFEEELERAGAPNIIPMAIIYIGPIIAAFGTPDQQARWLPDILESRAMWAQGYSEPESGSDLASLRMSAVRDGDDYILDGSKIWTSSAHWADWIFCLVRTSREARKQDGISMVCVDMTTPGISVHPIISIDGSHELNRVDFAGVRVPAANRIGEEGRGWHYANVLLATERLSYAHIGRKKAEIAALRALAADTPDGRGGTMAGDPAFGRRLAEAAIALEAIEVSVLRVLGGEVGAAAVSSLKIAVTEMAQRLTELRLELAGSGGRGVHDRANTGWAAGLPPEAAIGAPAMASYLFERAQTIYGGATEVQKTIVWRQLDRANGG